VSFRALGTTGAVVESSLEPNTFPDVVLDEKHFRAHNRESERTTPALPPIPIRWGGSLGRDRVFKSREEIRQHDPVRSDFHMWALPGSQIGRSTSASARGGARAEQNYRMLFESIDEGLPRCSFAGSLLTERTPVDSIISFCKSAVKFERATGSKKAAGRRTCAKSRHSRRTLVRIYGRSLTGERCDLKMKPNNSERWYEVYAFRAKIPSADASESLAMTHRAQSGGSRSTRRRAPTIAKCRRSGETRTASPPWSALGLDRP